MPQIPSMGLTPEQLQNLAQSVPAPSEPRTIALPGWKRYHLQVFPLKPGVGDKSVIYAKLLALFPGARDRVTLIGPTPYSPPNTPWNVWVTSDKGLQAVRAKVTSAVGTLISVSQEPALFRISELTTAELTSLGLSLDVEPETGEVIPVVASEEVLEVQRNGTSATPSLAAIAEEIPWVPLGIALVAGFLLARRI